MATNLESSRKSRGQSVSILGGVVQDLCTIMGRLADDGETVVASAFSMAPGGKGSNSAVVLHRLTRPNPENTQPPLDAAVEGKDAGGADVVHVRMVGAVGTDQFGPALKRNLVAYGVNVDGVRVLEGQTAIANILIEDDSGVNRIMHYPGGEL